MPDVPWGGGTILRVAWSPMGSSAALTSGPTAFSNAAATAAGSLLACDRALADLVETNDNTATRARPAAHTHVHTCFSMRLFITFTSIRALDYCPQQVNETLQAAEPVNLPVGDAP